MAYPSIITAFTNPIATNRLNAPSHSGIETAQNTDLTAIETFLGVEGASSTVGTLIYDVRSPASGGGGHVQSANKGGTGQTTYNKGDLLVGQSSSVLTKTAVGTDGQILSADSTKSTGVNWINNSTPLIKANASVQAFIGTGYVYPISASILGSTLGTSNVLKTTVYITEWGTQGSATVSAEYGGGVIASVFCFPRGIYSSGDLSGQINCTIIENGATNSQRGFLSFEVRTASTFGAITSVFSAFDSNVTSINSSADQTFRIGIAQSNPNPAMKIGGYIIEKVS